MPTAERIVLALACAAQFMVVLDISVVNVALPSMQAALGFDPASLQWVVNAYALAFAGFLLVGGRLADLYGRRRIFILGLVLFTASSLVGGLASTQDMLIAARAVQGLGAAMLAPATLTILTTTFPEGPRRTRALAAWTAVGLAGGTAGNVIGGLLTESLSWRWILLINVPVGALAIVLAARLLARDGRRGPAQRIDLAGAALATVGLASLTYGITQSEERSLTDATTASALAIGLGALALFVLVEARLTRAPLMPPRLFRVRAIGAGNLVMLLAGACFMPMWYFLSLSMQEVLDYGPLQTGLGFLPHTLVTMLVAMRLTPRLMQRIAHRTLIVAGALIAAAGFAWQSEIAPDSGYLAGILAPGIVLSIGGGLLNTPLTAAVTSGVSPSNAGAASGLMNTTKQVGGALGLAVLVAIGATDYGRAFLAIAAILVIVAAAALALPSSRDARLTRPAPSASRS